MLLAERAGAFLAEQNVAWLGVDRHGALHGTLVRRRGKSARSGGPAGREGDVRGAR
jgi:hypothetical protein